MGKYVQVRAGKIYEPKARKPSVLTTTSYVAVPTAQAFFSDVRFTNDIDLKLDSRIKQALDNASKELVAEASRLLPMAMRSSSWGFSGDIVDTGRLMRSMNVSMSGSRLQISYDEPYAGIVHYGGYILPYGNKDAAPVYIPARPWIEAVLEGSGPVESIDYEAIYQRAFAQVF